MKPPAQNMDLSIKYDKDHLISEAISSKRIIPVTVHGDGMQPEYLNGDVVFVDTLHKNPSGGGVFAFKDFGTTVCRCSAAEHGVNFIWKNHYFENQTCSLEVFNNHVVGRVVGHIKPCMITNIQHQAK